VSSARNSHLLYFFITIYIYLSYMYIIIVYTECLTVYITLTWRTLQDGDNSNGGRNGLKCLEIYYLFFIFRIPFVVSRFCSDSPMIIICRVKNIIKSEYLQIFPENRRFCYQFFFFIYNSFDFRP